MKILMPIGIAILGLGAGVGAGVALKPAPEAPAKEACVAHEGEACPPAADPLEPAPAAAAGGHGEKDEGPALVALDKPFVVPVFRGEKVVAMVVVSVAVEIAAESETAVEAVQPRLRDSFLAAMFRHANSAGFDGAFTTGQKMEDLRSALLVAARQVFPGEVVSEVLITEIARQDL
ncbi:MAG: flagellar basal body-associated FliL family protein [Rhodobacteraceae bacterium]|nr:flagellar basal body-associated FliL family protein [Paracoccaceae bacterium]